MSACEIKAQLKTTKFLPEITVNGQALDKTALAREIQYHPAERFQDALQQAAQALIVRQLLLEAAAQAGITGEEEARIAALIVANTPEIAISEAECETLYQQQPARFQTLPQMMVRHILFAAAPDDLDERQQRKTEAEALIARLQAAENLERIFVENLWQSACPSKENAGRLGELSPGQTVAEFERQVSALGAGLANHAIETRYGFHVVWVEDYQPGRQASYEEVKAKIAAYLHNRRERQQVADYLYHLVGKARIEGIELRAGEQMVFS